MKHPMTQLALALGIAITAPFTATAATPATATTKPAMPAHVTSDREAAKDLAAGKEELAQKLLTGHDLSTIRADLETMGYKITSVNEAKRDYVEYEIVKADKSYEVQIDLDPATQKAKKVDITTNLWRADSTKAAMQGKPYKLVKSDKTSDRAHMKSWGDEKQVLEKNLGAGHDHAYYGKRLKELGYTVTATNKNETDYLEYEVVKGRNSYEVQVDFDKGTGMSSKVDVDANAWKAEATERALGSK